MTNDPPAGEPEQRWQQPSFGQQPPGDSSGVPVPGPPVSGPGAPHLPARRVPPPSTVESVVGALSKVVWPVAILLLFTTRMGFVSLIVIAIVTNVILRAIRTNLRQRRYAALPPAPPTYPTHPPRPDDLR
ncbi:MAG: hypothetical protein GYA85_07020 [Propionibacterium sp.]|nr:hypothetical protein [Propionibacterium sp.]